MVKKISKMVFPDSMIYLSFIFLSGKTTYFTIIFRLSILYIRYSCFLIQTDISIKVIKLGKIENASAWFSKNKWNQPEPNMCWTASIKMILDELSDRHNQKSLKFSLRSINRTCHYTQKFGPEMEIVVPTIKNKIEKFGYITKEVEGEDRFNELKDILFNDDMSFPIVCFAPNYIKDQKGTSKAYNVPGVPDHYDHCVIVTNIGINDDIEIIDPLEGYLLKSSHINNVQTNMPKTKFLYYWSNSRTPYWIMWIGKIIKKNKTLDKWIKEEKIEYEQPIITV